MEGKRSTGKPGMEGNRLPICAGDAHPPLNARQLALLGLAYLSGATVHPFRLPIRQLDATEIWSCSDRALCRLLRLGQADRDRVMSFRASFTPAAAQRNLRQAGIETAFLGGPGYPEELAAIYDPPPALFIAGRPDWRQELARRTRIAIVGARAASGYGLDVAVELARDLAAAEVCVVSGLALGIDSSAHEGALEEEGGTLAVLGCGVDVVYPAHNRRLRAGILKSAMLVSEYPPGTEPRPWRFPARNRIIAGLSAATVVIEARRKSGALITADFSAEQGREVCAVPGSIFSELSAGPNQLIRNGAAAVTCAAEVLEAIGAGTGLLAAAGKSGTAPVAALQGLDSTGLAVIKAMDGRFRHLEKIAARAGITTQEAAVALLSLELKGLVRNDPGRGYAR